MSEDGPTGPFQRGHVVWHDGLFRESGRPWLVLSDDRHPFHGEEYLVAGLTTTDRRGAIEVRDTDWTVGGLPRESYVSPWFLSTLKHAEVGEGVGRLADPALQRVVEAVVGYLD